MADWDPFADPADGSDDLQAPRPQVSPKAVAWKPPVVQSERIRVVCLHGTCSNAHITKVGDLASSF